MQGLVDSEVGNPVESKKPEGVAVDRASTGERTLVIVLSQIVVLGAIAVAWPILRSRRSRESAGRDVPA